MLSMARRGSMEARMCRILSIQQWTALAAAQQEADICTTWLLVLTSTLPWLILTAGDPQHSFAINPSAEGLGCADTLQRDEGPAEQRLLQQPGR